MASEDRDQSPDYHPTQPDIQPPPPDPAADPTFLTPEEWDDQAATEQSPDSHDPPEKPADWEFNWREMPYDSFEDARQNDSHVGDPDTNYEWLRESDEQSPTGDESVRHRATGEWSEPDSLY
jgi:hypothetical protein